MNCCHAHLLKVTTKQQVSNGFGALQAKGVGTIILEPVVLEPLGGPAVVLQCQPEEHLARVQSFGLPKLFSTCDGRLS
jgi:hypothetical protein